jgi:ElaB/YqjD/DUF883 family membrane-anchored ribosome-binding protein
MSRSTPHTPSHRVGNGTYRQLEVEMLAVRQDVARIGQQVADALSNAATVAKTQAKGGYKDARKDVNSIVSHASDRAGVVVDAVQDAATSIENTFEDAIQTRPFASVALAFGLGILIGVTRRR